MPSHFAAYAENHLRSCGNAPLQVTHGTAAVVQPETTPSFFFLPKTSSPKQSIFPGVRIKGDDENSVRKKFNLHPELQ